MKRISYWVLSTVSVLVLLFGYHTSTAGAGATAGTSVQAPISGSVSGTGTSSTGAGSNPPDNTTGSSTSNSSSGSTGSSSSGSSQSSGSGSSSVSSAASKVTGSVAQTRWGPVQVELTVASGKITNVSVLQYPSGNGRDAEINSRALPVLIQETLNAQSASIDMVSGATVTSGGYLESLQSALDQAHL